MQCDAPQEGSEDYPDRFELEKRMNFLRFNAEDEARVKAADPFLEPHLEAMMDHLYSHFLANADTAAFSPIKSC